MSLCKNNNSCSFFLTYFKELSGTVCNHLYFFFYHIYFLYLFKTKALHYKRKI